MKLIIPFVGLFSLFLGLLTPLNSVLFCGMGLVLLIPTLVKLLKNMPKDAS